MAKPLARFMSTRTAWWSFGIALTAFILAVTASWSLRRPTSPNPNRGFRVDQAVAGNDHQVRAETQGELREPQASTLIVKREVQKEIGLKVETAKIHSVYEALTAPGRVTADETRYVQITPRASGVIRSVNAMVGQDVHAGDLLATIDSPDIGEARARTLHQAARTRGRSLAGTVAGNHPQ